MLKACHSIADLRALALGQLPGPIFNFLDGGAEDEVTLRANTSAFDKHRLIPRCLVDVGRVRTATRVLGQDLQWPLMLSPTGATRLFHPQGELAVARAAASAGVLYCAATTATHSLEEIAAVCPGPKLFQLTLLTRPDTRWELIERCKRAGYGALCITVDMPVGGKRERDLRAGFSIPPKWTFKSVASFARHPGWVLGWARKGPLRMANFNSFATHARAVSVRDLELDPAVTWKTVREIREAWGGAFAVKGILSADDAQRAVDAGASAIIVSNHGGRQLDGAATPIEVLQEIVQAVGSQVEVILDGGVRRGTHIVKALGCGAKACSVGRAYLYGLAVAGEAGVTRALEILRTELVRALQLSGCPDLESIDEKLIRYVGRNIGRSE